MYKDSIVLVDDEPALTRSLSMILYSNGYTDVVEFNDSREALAELSRNKAAMVICDLGMPFISGMELLQKLTENQPETPVIIATAVNEVDTAVECMKCGAKDYLVKPVKEQELLSAIEFVMQVCELKRENDELKKRLSDHSLRHPEAFREILTNSPKMHSLFEYMEVIAPSTQPVLITGDTGTGKELAARALHELHGSGEFIAVNVAGLDENTFSDTLFGHLRGAFTGADTSRPGLIEKAGNGTLFLDEIGDLSAGAQIKLLRLLQEKEYMPLGSDDPRHTNARFILATLRDLEKMVESGEFRRDLYYRLRQYHVHLPPLRERQEDLLLLADHFLTIAAKDLQVDKPELPSNFTAVFGNYHFPGNIRELQALMNEALSHNRGNILSIHDIQKRLAISNSEEARTVFSSQILQSLPTLPPLKDVRSLMVEEALRRSGGNQTLAARLLNVTRQAINKQLKGGND